MKFGVIVFPGSNCDRDCHHVLSGIPGVQAGYVWHQDTDVSGYDCLVLPGGFSYGDYLRSGAIARFSPVMEAVGRHAASGGMVIGICNGFQILLEAGLLPGVMMPNSGLKFICCYLHVRVENNRTPWTTRAGPGEVLRIPVAHNDGNYQVPAPVLEEMKNHGQVLLRYCSPEGVVDPDSNPNGSVESIAGICNREGNVLGMMPHPERASEPEMGSTDGLVIWESLLDHLGALRGGRK